MNVNGQNIEQKSKTLYQNDSLFRLHQRYTDYEEIPIGLYLDKKAVQKQGGTGIGVLSRISGVTFDKGSLLSIRGLSPRYSTVTIDGLTAPITEQTIKAFAIGLLPATAVQELSVFKSGSYNNQAEWAGALVAISTKAEVDNDYNNIALNIGYQHNFTFNTFLKDADYGSKFGDIFGYGADRRKITNDIVSRDEFANLSRNEAAEQGKLLRNAWELEKTNAIPSFKMAYSMGRVLRDNATSKLSTINSILYSRQQGGSHINRASYTGYETDETGTVVASALENYMTDGVYKTSANVSLNSGWFYKYNDKNEYNFDFTYSHQGTNSTLSRYRVALNTGNEAYAAQYGLLTKSVLLSRLTGAHNISEKTDIDWSFGVSLTGREEPDLRRSAAQRGYDNPDEPFLLIIPESSKADQGARFYSDLLDNAYGGRIDLNHDVIDAVFQLKAGAIIESTERDFEARIITSAKDDFTSPNLRFVNASELGTVYAPENYGPNGYYLVDGTTDYDVYNASNFTFGAYTGLENTFLNGRLKSAVGLRFESFNQQLASGDVDVDTDSNNVLPYLNLNYRLGARTILKAAYTKSLNRPAFRELSPFSFYDFDYRSDISGNPDLRIATIDNIDISLEHDFDRDGYFAINAFYKKITDPIEMVYIIRSDSPLFSFDNAAGAHVTGFELEFAKHLSNNEFSIFNQINFRANVTYTYSLIDLGSETNEVAAERPLQGQIPLVISSGLVYTNPKNTIQFNLDYLYQGKSLFSVGNGVETFPWYIKPQNFLNAGFSVALNKAVKLNLYASNIINTPYEQVEDANLDGKLNSAVDKQVLYGLSYQSYSISMSYNF
ncbi:TonB-dependent receptor [Formosa agariphila KMM 3901]|uniref:TonB-dependent receptor n=1 Tax=Formosa agariphila (strain DSM 15362 / KCTC 12365 / LMG 23005 / KMM 3901 / M-2Alg 35-1) TaxID=1347342 RepID=T2KLJ0_FORAG|nr:TonB-dependent receptor [Formosa agariphila KMM 3901]